MATGARRPPIGAAFSLPVVAYDLAPNGLIWA
jgi:hypothetical protein